MAGASQGIPEVNQDLAGNHPAHLAAVRRISLPFAGLRTRSRDFVTGAPRTGPTDRGRRPGAEGRAHAAGRDGVTDPAETLARSVLAVWEIADRYRLLVAPAQRTVTTRGIRERLTPVRENSVRLLRRGLDEGTFASPLPAPALAYVHEQILITLMETVNDGLLDAGEAGRSAAVTVLTASGVPANLATALVGRVSRSTARP